MNSSIWFSTPKQLNDKRDIRIAYEWDSDEVKDPAFFEKLHSNFSEFTGLKHNTIAFVAALLDYYNLIKKDPQAWFQKNQEDVRQGELYEQIGLFSTTKDPVSPLMWPYYAANHTGYCVGYDPYVIFSTKLTSAGIVYYTDEPLRFSYIKAQTHIPWLESFIKDKKWEHENEYRFITFFELGRKHQLVQLPIEATKEVIIGMDMSSQNIDEIVQCLVNKYESTVLLQKVSEGSNGHLVLKKIPY